MSLSNTAALVGVGTTRFGKLPGSTAWSLQAEAVRNALADAGLRKDEVDGMFTESQFSEPLLLHGHLLGRCGRGRGFVHRRHAEQGTGNRHPCIPSAD